MEEAYLKYDCKLKDGTIIPAHTVFNGFQANELYFKTGKKWEYLCPHCNLTMICANETVRFPSNKKERDKLGKKEPYFTPKSKSGDHKTCPGNQKNYLSDKNKPHKYTVEPKHPYYSKLIEPEFNNSPSDSTSPSKNLATTEGTTPSDQAVEERQEQTTTRHLEHICNHFLSIQKSNPPQIAEGSTPDYSQRTQALKDRALYLPHLNKTNYHYAFWSAQSRSFPRKFKSPYRIAYGKVQMIIEVSDGYLVVFALPNKDPSATWKPVIIWVSHNIIHKFENDYAAKLFNQAGLNTNPTCYVFGKLQNLRTHYCVDLEHLSWICFIKNNYKAPKLPKFHRRPTSKKIVEPKLIEYLLGIAFPDKHMPEEKQLNDSPVEKVMVSRTEPKLTTATAEPKKVVYYEPPADKEVNVTSEIKQKDVNKPNTSKQKRPSLFKRILRRFF